MNEMFQIADEYIEATIQNRVPGVGHELLVETRVDQLVSSAYQETELADVIDSARQGSAVPEPGSSV